MVTLQDDSSFGNSRIDAASVSANRPHPCRLSLVVPCFNEADLLQETHSRLHATFADVPGIDLEVIYVDDGSTDATLAMLKAVQANDNRTRVVSFSRNFGHQVAITAGLEHASGDAVVVMDADLQDPPEVVLAMLDRWRHGVDVAYGLRRQRHGETAFKRWSAKTFYRTINKISDTPIPLDTGDFRLMDRRVVDAILVMPERDRFVRGMVAWVGFRQEPVPYDRAARFAGNTKYPLSKMFRFATDGLLSFSLVPLRLASWLGFATAGLAVIGILYAVGMRLLTDVWVPGWTLLFIALLFMGGVQLVFLGIIGEYLGRTYGEVKRRPLYVVRERLGFPETHSNIMNPVSRGTGETR